MKSNISQAIRLTLICAVFFSGVYTLAFLGLAKLAPNQGKGEVIKDGNRTWFVNVGQKFTADKYFYSRPSAVDYNAAGSGGSNKGPSNPDYLKVVAERIDTFLAHNPGVRRENVPADLVTASGSGLDPDISVQAAKVQVKRIAAIRGVSESQLEEIIAQNTTKPFLGLFGTAKINVLKLNLALNKLPKHT
jgi:K+-transporting ATPase ATPase C chain